MSFDQETDITERMHGGEPTIRYTYILVVSSPPTFNFIDRITKVNNEHNQPSQNQKSNSRQYSTNGQLQSFSSLVLYH